jgi:hypothetical protein
MAGATTTPAARVALPWTTTNTTASATKLGASSAEIVTQRTLLTKTTNAKITTKSRTKSQRSLRCVLGTLRHERGARRILLGLESPVTASPIV